ncbi:MAG: zinc-binding dehydrogenase [Candidatus Nanopelagicales bacterium]
MFAVYAESINPADPLSGLVLGEQPEPEDHPGYSVQDGWTTVEVKAASLNHHDLWSLKGVGITEDRMPMILGCDGAGLDRDGNPVIIYPVVASGNYDDITQDPSRSILSEIHPGIFADRVGIPAKNLVPIPDGWSFAEAACLPTAWLTAYRMLAVRSGLRPGNTVLVQGAGGGVATACIALARAMGFRVWATSRSEEKRQRALEIGAHAVFASGERLPEKVDAVMETVGEATWDHSLRSLRPGGTIVISGATSGSNPPADLSRVFFLQLSVVGSTMGTLGELHELVGLCNATGVRPIIDREFDKTDARAAFEELERGTQFGKLILNF